MHRLVLQLSIVFLFLSGLACACPAIAAEEPVGDHSMHQSHGDDTEATDKPCCDDCDEATAMHPQSLPVVLDLRFMDDTDLPMALPVVIDTEWEARAPPGDDLLDRSRYLPHESPVDRRDRMLD